MDFLRVSQDRTNISYIAMTAKVLKELDLPQGTFGQDFLAEDIRNLLNCDTLVRLGIRGRTEAVN